MATRSRATSSRKATPVQTQEPIKRHIGKPVTFETTVDDVSIRFVCSPVDHSGRMLTNGSRVQTYVGPSKFAAKSLPVAAVLAMADLADKIEDALDTLDKAGLLGKYAPVKEQDEPTTAKAASPTSLAKQISAMSDDDRAALLAALTA